VSCKLGSYKRTVPPDDLEGFSTGSGDGDRDEDPETEDDSDPEGDGGAEDLERPREWLEEW
jgi:hypothetical protein